MTTQINTKWIYVISIVFIIVFFISIIVILVPMTRTDKIGTIDIQKIITHEAQKLATIYPKGDVPTDKLHGLIDTIRDNIQKVAQDKKIIFLAKGAVLSGNVPDYTDNFINELEDKSDEKSR